MGTNYIVSSILPLQTVLYNLSPTNNKVDTSVAMTTNKLAVLSVICIHVYSLQLVIDINYKLLQITECSVSL